IARKARARRYEAIGRVYKYRPSKVYIELMQQVHDWEQTRNTLGPYHVKFVLCCGHTNYSKHMNFEYDKIQDWWCYNCREFMCVDSYSQPQFDGVKRTPLSGRHNLFCIHGRRKGEPAPSPFLDRWANIPPSVVARNNMN